MLATLLGRWIYDYPQGKKIRLRPDEVIPFQEFNSENLHRGTGPVEAPALAIDTNRYAGEWNRSFFVNSAMPSVALMTEQKLTDVSYERLMAKWEDKFKGVGNAHKPAVLEGELKVQLLNNSAKNMASPPRGKCSVMRFSPCSGCQRACWGSSRM